jgi:hypothetical protein
LLRLFLMGSKQYPRYPKPMAKLDNYVKTFFGLMVARWVAKILLPVIGVILLIVLLFQFI